MVLTFVYYVSLLFLFYLYLKGFTFDILKRFKIYFEWYTEPLSLIFNNFLSYCLENTWLNKEITSNLVLDKS